MLDEETFIINFNSQGSQVINNGNLNAVSYNCAFGALPRKYNKYRVRLNFRSLQHFPWRMPHHKHMIWQSSNQSYQHLFKLNQLVPLLLVDMHLI